MIYLKSIFVGAASFIVTVAALNAISVAVLVHYPKLAMRIFPAQNFDIVIGSHYYVNFPLWRILAAGVVAFIIGFAWMFKRVSART